MVHISDMLNALLPVIAPLLTALFGGWVASTLKGRSDY